MFAIISRLNEMHPPAEVDIQISALEKLLMARHKRQALARGTALKLKLREAAAEARAKGLAEAARLDQVVFDLTVAVLKNPNADEVAALEIQIVEHISEASRLRAFA